MRYTRLTREERYQIIALRNGGLSKRKTAVVLGRSPSTISRELRRNTSGFIYRPRVADKMACSRRSKIHPKFAISGLLRSQVVSMLEKQWSPEQIVGDLAKNKIYTTHETIYQFIYREFKLGRNIYLNCRRKRKYRRTRLATFNYKNKRKNKNAKNIEHRPKVVDLRERLGDLERDTIVGKQGTAALLTIVDRASRLTMIGKVTRLNPRLTHELTIKLLKRQVIRTITNDNGQEFQYSEQTEKALKTDIYFNNPYSSWERGTNENTNGLIRQYFPKGTNFDEVTDTEIKNVECLLNNRPRKTLGFKSPLEVHKKKSQGVALRN